MHQVCWGPAARKGDTVPGDMSVMLIHEWGMPLAVLAMLLTAPLMAYLLNRYQAHQSSVLGRVRHLEAGASGIADALAALRGVPLSRELRLILRSEILARYQAIRRLSRRSPGIADRVRAAEAALHAEGVPAAGGVGPIEDERALRRMIRALDLLQGVMLPGGLLQAVPADVRGIFRRELGERRAEVMARFHLVESRRQEQAGNLIRARTHLKTLLHGLRQHGPGTGFVRALRAETQAALSSLGAGLALPSPVDDRRGDPAMLLQRRLAG